MTPPFYMFRFLEILESSFQTGRDFLANRRVNEKATFPAFVGRSDRQTNSRKEINLKCHGG